MKTELFKKRSFVLVLCIILVISFILSACTPGIATDTTSALKPETSAPVTTGQIIEDIDLYFEEPILWLKTGEETEIKGNVFTDKNAKLTVLALCCNPDETVKIENNKITALKQGSVMLHAENEYTGKSADMMLRVTAGEADETVVVCAPVWVTSFLTRTQLELIRDAGFTHINLMNGSQTDSEVILVLKKCAEIGIGLYPGLSSPDLHETKMTREQIKARIDLFKPYEAFCGFCLQDEPPSGFEDYARAAQTVYELDPTLTCMINFLPSADYSMVSNFAAQLYDHDYKGVISMDNYIFGLEAGSVDEFWLFRNFEMYRNIGMKNRVRTGFYLQAIGSDYYNYRRPDEGTLFYHSMLGLAYGFTIMRYFSYLTPNSRFTDGIIGADLKATDTYPACCALNEKCKVYGRILVNSLAKEIYHTGRKINADADYELIPDDYFIYPEDPRFRTVLSVFTDRKTESNYLMIVNKDFSKDVSITYNLKNVPYLYEVNDQTGMLEKIDVSSGKLTVNLTKGNARLYVLPYDISYTEEKAVSDNLLLEAYVAVSSAKEEYGYCAEYLTDGITEYTDSSVGYKPFEKTDSSWIYIDMDKTTEISRIEFYPAGKGSNLGKRFPEGIEVTVSEDGVNWKTVKTASFKKNSVNDVQSITFDSVNTRYIKINITGMTRSEGKYYCEIAEICAYKN